MHELKIRLNSVSVEVEVKVEVEAELGNIKPNAPGGRCSLQN